MDYWQSRHGENRCLIQQYIKPFLNGPVLLNLTAANEEFLACLYQQAEVVPLGCFFSSEANFDECLTLLRG
ncbi:hypothetical protein Q8W13_21665 [Photobacterium damselae subsp. piscicida]|nr:hypothetical protein [Photobacterium damselae subsp. piscicida]